MDLIQLLLYTTLTLLTFVPFLRWLQKRHRFISRVNKIPGNRAYPLIGTSWEFVRLKRSGNWIRLTV
jgi:hypothetical protein